MIRCPYCGKPFGEHADGICPQLDAAMTRQLRAAVEFVMRDRDRKIKELALSSAITPRRYALDNSTPAGKANNAQLIAGFNLQRGVVVVYNDDVADVMLAEDGQHAHDATKQFVLKAKSGIAFTSPNELWAVGTTAGPQNVYVLELPPGRGAAEAIALLGYSIGTTTTPSATRIQDGTGANLGTVRAGLTGLDGVDGVNQFEVAAYGFVFNGAHWDRLRSGLSLDAGLSAGVLAAHDTKIANAAAATVATEVLSSLQTMALASARQVSAANAANVLIIDLRNLATSLDIDSLASGGTATLQVEVSTDNVNYIALEAPIAAALHNTKHYGANTVGGTVALSPLSFRYVRITAGAAGVGFTTTLTVGAK